MSRKPEACGPNLDPIHLAGRRLSCETIMFHQSVADRLGLNVTDHKCIDFLLLNGPCTAGELSQRSALTTGAITAVVDRLEKAGFVYREADPNDRRRVIVHPMTERLGEIGLLFTDLATRMKELSQRYSEKELAAIVDFMNCSCEILHDAALQMREETAKANDSKLPHVHNNSNSKLPKTSDKKSTTISITSRQSTSRDK